MAEARDELAKEELEFGPSILSPQSFRLILDAFADAVVIADTENRIVYANDAVAALLGRSRLDLVGRPVTTIVPPRLRPLHLEGFARYVQTGKARIMGRPIRVEALSRDGSEVPVEVSLSGFTLGGRQLIVGSIRDLRTRVELERESEVARDLLRVMAEATGLEDATARTLQAMCSTLNWDAGAAWVVDEDAGVLRCLDFWHEPSIPVGTFAELSKRRTFRRGIGLPGRVWASEQAAWIEDVQQDENFPRAAIAVKEGVHAGFAFPVTARGHFLGVVEFFSREIRSEDPGLLQTMTAIGEELGHLILRKRLDADLEESNRRLAFLAEASRALTSSLDFRSTLERITHLAVPELGDWCIIDLFEQGTIHLAAVSHIDPEKVEIAHELRRRYPPDPDGSRGVPKVLRSGESELYPEIDDELLVSVARDEEHLELLRELGLCSALIVPLPAKGRTLGALTLASTESERRYGRDDLLFLEDVARRAALAIENARLYKQQSNIARTLQQSLLPTALPEIPRLEVATSYRPTAEGTEVGGDFFDLFKIPDGWGVMIGDVSGKGVEAAAITSLTRFTVRTASMQSSPPADVLALLNQAMIDQLPEDRFCTIAYATIQFDGHGARLTISCAGHPPPMILRADGSVEDACPPGALLGVFPNPGVEEMEVQLYPGDLVLFYTDGLSECWGPLAPEGLQEALHQARGRSPAQTIAEMEQEALRVSEGRHRDDMALLSFKVKSDNG